MVNVPKFKAYAAFDMILTGLVRLFSLYGEEAVTEAYNLARATVIETSETEDSEIFAVLLSLKENLYSLKEQFDGSHSKNSDQS